MNIQPTNQIGFTARNKEICYADKIMRNMMNLYPSMATSKVDYYMIAKRKPVYKHNKVRKNMELTQLRIGRRNVKHEDLPKKVIQEVQQHKIANCGELSLMAMGSFLANGFNDVKLVFLKLKQKYGKEKTSYMNIDHCFLLVNSGKNSKVNCPKTINKHAFIVDPWAGFVDYLESGLTRYEKFFMRGQKKMPDEKQRFILGRINVFKPTSKTEEKMAKDFPELIVKQ